MSLIAELKRRNVVRVALAYGVVGWLLAQVADLLFGTFGAPDWALKTFVIVLFLAGLVILTRVDEKEGIEVARRGVSSVPGS